MDQPKQQCNCEGCFARQQRLRSVPEYTTLVALENTADEYIKAVRVSREYITECLRVHGLAISSGLSMENVPNLQRILKQILPDIPPTTRPEYAALQKANKKQKIEPRALDTPLLNLEDLSCDGFLWQLLQSRIAHTPSLFIGSDLDNASVEWDKHKLPDVFDEWVFVFRPAGTYGSFELRHELEAEGDGYLGFNPIIAVYAMGI